MCVRHTIMGRWGPYDDHMQNIPLSYNWGRSHWGTYASTVSSVTYNSSHKKFPFISYKSKLYPVILLCSVSWQGEGTRFVIVTNALLLEAPVTNTLVLEANTLKTCVQTSASLHTKLATSDFQKRTYFEMIATHRFSPSKRGGNYHILILTCEYTTPTSYIHNSILCWTN